MKNQMDVRAVSAAQTTDCGPATGGAQPRMRLSRFALLALASTALTVPGAAMAAPLVLAGDYIKIGVNDTKGTLGSGGSSPPGILYDGTGTGTFNASYDYLTPGTPMEGFTISGTGSSPFSIKHNNATGGSYNASLMTGTLTDYSGVAFGGETFDNRAVWEATVTGQFTISHDYRFNDGGQQLMVVTTITALTDLTGLGFARYTDPDAVAASGDSSATNNFQGQGSVSADNLVYAEATVSKYVIGLYSNSTVTHKTAVTSWTTDVSTYLAGASIGNGDNTIGLGFDIGSLLNGDSIVLNYSYIFGTNIANAISDAGAGGGTTPAPAGPTPIDAGPPSTVEDLLSGKVTPVFDGGTLTLAGGGQVDKDFTVKETGGGVDTAGHDLTLTGALSGPGVLEKTGAGVLTLTGENSHGGFKLNEGTLAIASDSALGTAGSSLVVGGDSTLKILDPPTPQPINLAHTIRIDPAKTLTLNTGANTVSTPGGIIGGGNLTKTGPGQLILDAATINNMVVDGGVVSIPVPNIIQVSSFALNADTTLKVDGGGQINAAISFQGPGARIDTGANNLVLGGVISGGACLIKTGAGDLNLVSAASNDIGACVQQGSMSFNNVFAGDVWVETNAKLGGGGTIVGDVQNKGVVSPGNSPGQLVVAGSMTMDPGSTLALDIDGPTAGVGKGHHDTLVLTGAGSVFTAGGTIAPILRGITGDAGNTYTPSIGDAFQVVVAEGGVAGAFAGVTQPTDGMPANTRFDVVYMPKAVVLAVTAKSYAALDLGTTNARTLGGVADALRPAAGVRGVANSFTDGLTGLKQAQLAAVLQQASGEAHADAVEGQLQSQRAARGQVTGRLADGLDTGRRVWGEYAADSFQLDGNADASGFDADRTGMIFGVDGRLSPTLLVGAALSYGETRLDADGGLGASKTESYQGHVYAAWRSGDYYVNGLVSAGTDQYRTSRRVGLSTGARAYEGRADGTSLAADVEAGRDFLVGPARLTLAAGLASDRVKRDALTETGDASAALAFDSDTRQALQGRIGAKVSAKALVGRMKVAPRAALFVTQEFDDTATSLGASLQGRRFSVTTADAGRTAVTLATAADASLTDRLRVGVGYQYGWSDGGESHAARVRAAITW